LTTANDTSHPSAAFSTVWHLRHAAPFKAKRNLRRRKTEEKCCRRRKYPEEEKKGVSLGGLLNIIDGL